MNRINESDQGMESRNRIKESNQGIESKKPIKSLKPSLLRFFAGIMFFFVNFRIRTLINSATLLSI